MRKIIISGGPSTGKSTVFERLKDTFPGAYFIEEAAEQVILREQAKHAADPSYTPIMPLTSYIEFAPLVIAQQIADEASIPPESELVIMDRSHIDNRGYMAHNGITKFESIIKISVAEAGYDMVFFCDWLDKFERTAVRLETPKVGLAIHRQLELAYEQSGILMIHLPAVSVEDRLAIIQTELQGV